MRSQLGHRHLYSSLSSLAGPTVGTGYRRDREWGDTGRRKKRERYGERERENNNNNLRVSNIRVSNRTLIYNVCPKCALT